MPLFQPILQSVVRATTCHYIQRIQNHKAMHAMRLKMNDFCYDSEMNNNIIIIIEMNSKGPLNGRLTCRTNTQYNTIRALTSKHRS